MKSERQNIIDTGRPIPHTLKCQINRGVLINRGLEKILNFNKWGSQNKRGGVRINEGGWKLKNSLKELQSAGKNKSRLSFSQPVLAAAIFLTFLRNSMQENIITKVILTKVN